MGSTEIEGRLLTQILDDLAEKTPTALYCTHPTSQDGKHDWRNITVHDFAQAVDRLAWWIDQKLDGQREQQVLAYIGTNDLRYAAFMLACMKTGHATLLLSTRNSQQAQRHLLQATKCSVIVDGSERTQLRSLIDELEATCADIPLNRWKIDSMWDIFTTDPVSPYPHDVGFFEVEDLPAIIIHSSGTTGNPKPVTLTHGYLATLDNMRTLPVPPGREIGFMCLLRKGELRFFQNPLFHFMGIICVVEGLFFQTPFLLAPDRPLTGSLFAQIMDLNDHPTWGVFAPFTLETLSASDDGLRALKKLSGVNCGGAPMAQATGNMLTSDLRLQTIIGSSETSYTPGLLCEDPADWGYHEWCPSFELRMEDMGEGLCELVLPRPNSRRYHGIFHAYPHLNEYRTGDLFQPHPSKPGLWRYAGRGDDVIVLSNGEKLNPIEAEKMIESHPLVSHAAISGQDRFQTALLIEPEWERLSSSYTVDELREDLWPLIGEANTQLPAHGQIFGSHIAFASRDRPFSVSPKGSIRRRDISKAYDTVLGELYEHKKVTEEPAEPAEPAKMALGTGLPEIQQWIQHQVAQILALDSIGAEGDLVTLGMDSLQIVRLAQTLDDAQHQLLPAQQHTPWTSPMIYDLATIPALANAVYKSIHGDTPETTEISIPTWSREDTLTKFIWEQAQFLGTGGLTVALTGSTGELGSYLLNTLLQDPSIKQIICLNRSADAAERQLASFEDKRLSSAWLTETDRVKFWHSSLDEEYLGLALDKYNYLQGQIDVVIHNAWLVNFNLPVAAFKSQIIGLRRLLALVEKAPHDASFHFVSSVSTVAGLSAPGLVIPETLHGMAAVLQQGYGESKFVGESICGIASQNSNSRIVIHRVGQLGGPSDSEAGIWNTRDWFPSLVRSSQTMQRLPDSLGSFQVDWVPIDAAARIMTEIVQSHRDKPPGDLSVYHIANPRATNWKKLTGVVAKACDAKVIPLNEWVRSLESHAASSDADLRNLPAASLLGFFRTLVERQDEPKSIMSIANSQRDSATIRAMGSVDEKLMKVWLRQWKDWFPGLDI